MNIIKNRNLISLILGISVLLSNATFIFAEEDVPSEESGGSMTSDSQIDTSTIFEMPAFSSDTMIEIYRPVQLFFQEFAIPRPLKLTNYYSNMAVVFQKNTKVVDENGNLLAPLLKTPRKTLPNSANIPLPEDKLVYEFFITFGNYCNLDLATQSTNKNDQEDICQTLTEHFSPSAKMIFPLPEKLTANNFDLRFFDTTKWIWRKQLFIYEETTNLVKLDLPKSGLIAFVNKSGVKVDASEDLTKQVSLSIPANITNDKFIIKYYDLIKKKWINLDFTIDSENNKVSFITPKSSIIAFVPSVVSAISTSSQKPNLFLDVKSSDWFYDDISSLINKGVFKKDIKSNFRPEEQINRAEAAKILKAAFDLPPATNIDLTDISVNDWFANSAQSIINLGIMSPYFNNQFLPEKKLSRAEVLTVILRAGKIKIKDNMAQIGADKKRDVSIDDWYAPAVGFGIVNSIISLDSSIFIPNSPITRAQFSKMVNKTVEYIETANEKDLEENFGQKLEEKMVFESNDLITFKKDIVNLENGLDVLRLKKILYHLGYFKGKFDQTFDGDLQVSLKNFQFKQGIFSNESQLGVGRFGSKTRAKINQIIPSLR